MMKEIRMGKKNKDKKKGESQKAPKAEEKKP